MFEIINSKTPIAYQKAISFMEDRVDNIIQQKSKNLLWFLEHPSLYTAGTSAKSEDLLDAKSIPVYQTNRGGQYTYHGPGQRIVYIMMDLKEFFYPNSPDIHKFVVLLENWLINSLSLVGIKGEIIPGHVGVWVRSKNYNNEYAKIASIGIRSRKWVTYHGIAINIDPNLEYFKGIVPCGISDKPVTSLLGEGAKISELNIDNVLISSFKKVFGVDINY